MENIIYIFLYIYKLCNIMVEVYKIPFPYMLNILQRASNQVIHT